MCINDVKNDLISEAELLIYQIKAAQLNTDYEKINTKASHLVDVCKKLDFVRQEEERLYKQSNSDHDHFI